MEKTSDRLYPSASLEIKNNGLEQRLEKKWRKLTVLRTQLLTLKKWLHTSKLKIKNQKETKKYKKITTIIKSFDTIFIIATTSSSIKLSLMGIGLKDTTILSSIACGLSNSIKTVYEIGMQKILNIKNNMKKIIKLLNFMIKYTGKVYQIIYLINFNMNLYKKFLLPSWMKQKMNLFYNKEFKNKINFFSDNELKFNL